MEWEHLSQTGERLCSAAGQAAPSLARLPSALAEFPGPRDPTLSILWPSKLRTARWSHLLRSGASERGDLRAWVAQGCSRSLLPAASLGVIYLRVMGSGSACPPPPLLLGCPDLSASHSFCVSLCLYLTVSASLSRNLSVLLTLGLSSLSCPSLALLGSPSPPGLSTPLSNPSSSVSLSSGPRCSCLLFSLPQAPRAGSLQATPPPAAAGMMPSPEEAVPSRIPSRLQLREVFLSQR